jgi:hypothetical protein
MVTNINTEFAFNLGAEFATEINCSPDADNWHVMACGSEVPDGDYRVLRDHYNYYDLEQNQIAAIEHAYKVGFNSAFIPNEQKPVAWMYDGEPYFSLKDDEWVTPKEVTTSYQLAKFKSDEKEPVALYVRDPSAGATQTKEK